MTDLIARQDQHMAAIRDMARKEFGMSDDATCFRLAVILLMAEMTGYHHSPLNDAAELKLDGRRPVV